MDYYGVRTTGGLYHHGVKGMHWGVRRYQNTDGSLTSAGTQRYYGRREDMRGYKYQKPGEKFGAAVRRNLRERSINKLNAKGDKYLAKSKNAKTNFGAVVNAAKAGNSYARAERKQQIANAKGIRGKASEIFGSTGGKHVSEANAKTYNLMADAARKDNSKVKWDSYAYNAGQAAKYHERIAKSKSVGQRFVNTYGGALKMNIKSSSGRKTTIGKETALGILTAGYGNMAADVVYKRTSHGKEERAKAASRHK